MKKYVCIICGYVYDEISGNPEIGIAPGTKWEDLLSDWVCPLCGATKNEFEEQKTINQAPNVEIAINQDSIHEGTIHEDRELSFGELSALCSNLSKGCEKQYKPEEANLFNQLSNYYKSKAGPIDKQQFADIAKLIDKDLEKSYLSANSVATKDADRGALRALAWSEKVTMMLNSLLKRHETEPRCQRISTVITTYSATR